MIISSSSLLVTPTIFLEISRTSCTDSLGVGFAGMQKGTDNEGGAGCCVGALAGTRGHLFMDEYFCTIGCVLSCHLQTHASGSLPPSNKEMEAFAFFLCFGHALIASNSTCQAEPPLGVFPCPSFVSPLSANANICDVQAPSDFATFGIVWRGMCR